MSSLTFEHVNLNTVDPGQSSLPVGDYVFEVVDAGFKDYEKDGQTGQRFNLGLAVVSGPSGTVGRRIYESLFPDKEGKPPYSAQKMKLIANATGIQQSGTIEQWADAIKAARPRFSAPTMENTYNGVTKVVVNMFKVGPAS